MALHTENEVDKRWQLNSQFVFLKPVQGNRLQSLFKSKHKLLNTNQVRYTKLYNSQIQEPEVNKDIQLLLTALILNSLLHMEVENKIKQSQAVKQSLQGTNNSTQHSHVYDKKELLVISSLSKYTGLNGKEKSNHHRKTGWQGPLVKDCNVVFNYSLLLNSLLQYLFLKSTLRSCLL